VEVVDQGDFARAWAVAPQRFAWLLGAGASAAAGLPTATQIRDDLLLRVYAQRHNLVRQNLNANDPSVRGALDQYFNGRNDMVAFGSDDDYSCAFELALGDKAARRHYLQGLLSGRRPSYGQRIFGALLTAGFINVATTTNFDSLIEQAAAESYSAVNDADRPRVLRVAALGSVDRARQVLFTQTHPLLVKLHGDFGESSLKNLSSELVAQDEVLRQSVHDISRTVGLAVVGYSGRDDSVMEMLETATSVDNAWPAGIWWFAREPDCVPDRVRQLLETATENEVPAYLVALETFDELMADLALQAELTTEAREYISGLKPAASIADASPPSANKSTYPIIRYNALPILKAPTTALCGPLTGIDFEEFRTRARSVEWKGVAVMAGGVAWGWGEADQFAQIVGAKPEVVEVDLISGELEPGLHALLTQGLTRAIAGRLPAKPRVTRRESLVLLQEWDNLSDGRLATLRKFKKAYDGHVTGRLSQAHGSNFHNERRSWSEAVRLHVEFRWGIAWLIFSPFTFVEWLKRDEDDEETIDRAAEWRRERWVQRKKNEKWAELIDAWATSIAPDRKAATLHLPRGTAGDTFGSFEVGPFSAFSWRSS